MTDESITIRQLEPADVLAVARLLDQLGYPVDAGTLRRRMHTLRDSPSADAFVAVDSHGRVVGLASLHRLVLLTEDAPLGFITSLVVEEQARGKGIGRKLVAELCRRARALGCARITLTTHLRRADAHGFYERVGFEFNGRRYVMGLERAT